ncbi:Hypothetical protein, putative [Bodo saltans]|uniref:Uncharacterized protein n=1 Tax=Bodo saltans TaxID=75058 RepID=A0A0S4JNI3_BODSA|nr:Hypothetical protein, putative [Bodo saltans]|eukprot:CUG91995.1 Hypothetical protein, putative [Bodo saltans]
MVASCKIQRESVFRSSQSRLAFALNHHHAHFIHAIATFTFLCSSRDQRREMEPAVTSLTTSTSYASSSFVSESNRILGAIEDTERGLGHEWKNVQPAVVESTRKLHQAMQHMTQRMDSMEGKLDQLLIVATQLNTDRKAREERYVDDKRVWHRTWEDLRDGLDALRSDFERNAGAHSELVRVLQDITIPELQHELDGIKAIHQSHARKEHRIEQLERDVLGVHRTKIDVDEYRDQIRLIEAKLSNIELFPVCKPQSGGSGGGDLAAGLSVSRWVLRVDALATNRPLPWDRAFHVGTSTAWNDRARHVIKVQEEGIYRLSLAVFHNNRDHCAPSVSIFIDNDPIIHALSSTTVLRQHHRNENAVAATCGACTRCRLSRCCCDPETLNGITVNDILLLPARAIVTIAYKGDRHYLHHGMLELQRLT